MHANSSSMSSFSSLDDEFMLACTRNPVERQVEDENEDDDLEFVYQELPDVTFEVEGVAFPCHLKILSKQCAILHDIVSINGVQRRLYKKQRTLTKGQEYMQRREQRSRSSSSSSSTITVVQLGDIEHKIFRALLEFLYTNELPTEFYWGDREGGSSSLFGGKNCGDCGEPSEESQEHSIYGAMRFLQTFLIVADRFQMVSLKHEIEYRLYDEFLYSFTAAELFVWADSHSCAFLKEKAMDRICNKGALIDDFFLSKDGWTMIRQSKRLLEELFLYATYGSHGVRCIKYNYHESDHESNELNYYKVEYLRLRLSELELDVDGTRKMLEGRLRPHLNVNHRHFLPTNLTKLSEKNARQDQNQKVCFNNTQTSSQERPETKKNSRD